MKFVSRTIQWPKAIGNYPAKQGLITMMNNFSIKRITRVVSNVLMLVLLFSCAAPQHQTLRTEKDYQIAFNRVYFRGKAKMEVPVKYGRVDLLTDDYAIEVDSLEKFHEAIGQSLHYAKETGKKPGIAIFIMDPKQSDKAKLKYLIRLCNYYRIKVWFINEELEKEKKK
jgi:hypothetical protein